MLSNGHITMCPLSPPSPLLGVYYPNAGRYFHDWSHCTTLAVAGVAFLSLVDLLPVHRLMAFRSPLYCCWTQVDTLSHTSQSRQVCDSPVTHDIMRLATTEKILTIFRFVLFSFLFVSTFFRESLSN